MKMGNIYSIILLLIIFGGLFVISQNNFHVLVGDARFNIPNGFGTADDEMIGITNGTMSIFFNDTKKTDLNNTVSEYVNLKATQNSSVQITKLQIKGNDVYKSTIDGDSSTLHYWFIRDGKVYDICTWNGNQYTDNLISEIL